MVNSNEIKAPPPEAELSILIVEDNPILREGLADLFTDTDFSHVMTATNGLDGVSMFSENRPDIVLMDIAMPMMDGYQATLRIKEIDPTARVLALTARGEREDVLEGKLVGFSDYIIKPVTRQELLDRIRMVCGRSKEEELDLYVSSLQHSLKEVMGKNYELRSQLRELKEKSNEVEKNDTDLFISALLHQFTNTIIPIRELVRLSNKGNDPKKYNNTIESLLNQSLEILQRIREPLVSWEIKNTDLTEVVDSALKQIPIPTNIETIIDIPEDAKFILGNADALRTVFVNMINNSIQSMPQGGNLIIRGIIDGSLTQIRIIDSGSGIPEGIQLKLFTPFFSTKQDGSGLGLWLSRKMVERLSGTLKLEWSKESEGSAFLIILPKSEKV